MSLEQRIEEVIGAVRLDTLDISLGEFLSLYREKEFIIQPDFQRYFRWDDEQRSRLIESIVLELPIPQIFVIENESGVLELIDGLQRISSVAQFIEPALLNLPQLTLVGCDLVRELNGLTFEDLSTVLRLRIKRSSVRTVVIKRQSTPMLKYAMFKRLNTGGTDLSDQEIRNCTSRMAGVDGSTFYEFLRELSQDESFKNTTESLPESVRDQRGDEELVLRFFALKDGSALFKGSVRAWLDDFMEEVIFARRTFDFGQESLDFKRLFSFLSEVMGDTAFVRYRGTKAMGALAPAHFEAVTLGTWQTLDKIESLDPLVVRNRLIDTVQSVNFKANVGPGSNSLTKFRGRIEEIRNALEGLAG